MSYEYKIIAALPSIEVGEKMLLAAGNGSANAMKHGVEYRSSENQSGMPNALAKVEPYGFYFCENERHGLAAEVLGFIVALATSYGAVCVEELE